MTKNLRFQSEHKKGGVVDQEKKNSNATEFKIIGVGGGGCNAIKRMLKKPAPGCRYVACNTDIRSLDCTAAISCAVGNEKLAEQRRQSVNERADMMARAEALYPTPYTQNFPLRQLLVEYTKRQDMVNHPWYTYIFSDTGAITHYFVSTTLPVSTNAFLGSTEAVYDDSNGGNLVLTAPSLDGIYYGGAGSSSNQNGWIFIDAATGAMGVAYGQKILTFEAPLILQTEPILIQARVAP